MSRFVFVPIFGDQRGASEETWLQLPHVKAWGFFEEDDGTFVPIHSDPSLESLEFNEPYVLFQGELDAMRDVPENSTDLPDGVCLALAKLALLPVSRAD